MTKIRRLRGVFDIDNSTPDIRVAAWVCPICGEKHRYALNKSRYVQFSDILVCPNDGQEFEIGNYLIYNN